MRPEKYLHVQDKEIKNVHSRKKMKIKKWKGKGSKKIEKNKRLQQFTRYKLNCATLIKLEICVL